MEDLFFHNIEKYVYDECSKEEMKLFEQHMETCENCREEYKLSLSVKNAMGSMNTVMPPADFSKLVNERLDRELAAPAKPRMLKVGYRKYSAVAACLVLVAVLGTQNTDMPEPVIETSTFTDQSLQPVPDNAQPQDQLADFQSTIVAEDTADATAAPKSTASTINTPATIPAVTVTTPAEIKDSDVLSRIPAHLNPENQVVLASSVEKTYEISGISPEDIPRKERDLAAEFALLETTNSGAIVANAATISSMEGVKFRISNSNSTPKDYGIGSGSLFISSSDKKIVGELLTKYITVTDKDCYFFTSDNYDLFMQEMNNYGITYQERVISKDGGNLAFKLIIS